MNKTEYREYLDKNYRKEGLKKLCIDQNILTENFKTKSDLLDCIVDNYNPQKSKNVILKNRKMTVWAIIKVIGVIIAIVAGSLTIKKAIEKQFQPFGVVKGLPNTFYGPLVSSNFDRNTTINFNGQIKRLKDGFCFSNDNSSECQIEIKSLKPNIFGKVKISMSAIFFNNKGEISGQISNNNFNINKDSKLKYKYDKNAVEIYDEKDNTIFQMEYSSWKNEIKVFGIFYNKNGTIIIANNPFGYVLGGYTYISEASGFEAIEANSLRPIFKHNTIEPKGERIVYNFDKLIEYSNNGNALIVLDKSMKSDQIRINKLIAGFNEKLVSNGVLIRSHIIDYNEKLGEGKERIQQNLLFLGNRWANHYEYILSLTKESDTNYLLMIALCSKKQIVYAYSESLDLQFIYDGTITPNALNGIFEILNVNLPKLQSNGK